MKIAALAASGLLLLVTGCSELPSIGNPLDMVTSSKAIHVDVKTNPGAMPLLRAGQQISLSVAGFADTRKGVSARKVGRISSTVRDMHGSELLLDQDASALLGEAVRKQLAADGFRLVGTGEAADFRLEGDMRAFSLDIAGRDEITISTELRLREAGSGVLIWSGVVAENSDRYAGVAGNTQDSITKYLGEGVTAFAGKLSAAVRDSLSRSYPQSVKLGGVRSVVSSIPGVTTLQEPVVRDSVAAEVRQTEAASAPALPVAAVAQTGYFSVYTVPARAKVYVDDVYYGMSPLKIELPAGVSALSFKLDGYKTVAEKVAVRRGETTEMEVKFMKK